MTFTPKTCPSCGRKSLQVVHKSYTRKARGRSYVVPALEYLECRLCKEKVFTREAMATIERHAPARPRLRAA
jgi:YgiT-type zinc finger domain-containing protein